MLQYAGPHSTRGEYSFQGLHAVPFGMHDRMLLHALSFITHDGTHVRFRMRHRFSAGVYDSACDIL